MWVKPPSLRPGARVAIVAPAGPFDRELFANGLAVLRSRYEVIHTDAIFAQERYLAGSDDHRLADLSNALSDPSIHAVFSARGGYGVMRLLRRLDPARFPPKLLVGFSDVTALHAAWQAHHRVSIHGPVITQLGRAPRDCVDRLFAVLESAAPAEPLAGTECYVPGTVEGPLIGGNLSVLTRLLGTPFMPPLDGAVLLLEDVGERPYRLDRMWTHLRLAGVFEKVAGVALGEFTGCDEPGEPSLAASELLRSLARETGLPCASGFLVGHENTNMAVPLGVRARLDAAAATLSFLEPHAVPSQREASV